MQNISQPLQNIRKFIILNVALGKVQTIELELGPNEFYQDDDWLGFFSGDVAVQNFFTIEKLTDVTDDASGGA